MLARLQFVAVARKPFHAGVPCARGRPNFFLLRRSAGGVGTLVSAREVSWSQKNSQAPGAAGAASDRAYVKTRSSAGKRDVGGRSGAAENHHRGDERLLAFQNGGQECHRSLQVLAAGLGCLRSLWRRVCPGNVAHAGQLECICPIGPIFCDCTHSLHIWGGACPAAASLGDSA